jgi:hypothetical protein
MMMRLLCSCCRAGYEWNKYNQTHYDYDNPPPKVVQGYKFNILYHDLIDKAQVGSYGRCCFLVSREVRGVQVTRSPAALRVEHNYNMTREGFPLRRAGLGVGKNCCQEYSFNAAMLTVWLRWNLLVVDADPGAAGPSVCAGARPSDHRQLNLHDPLHCKSTQHVGDSAKSSALQPQCSGLLC